MKAAETSILIQPKEKLSSSENFPRTQQAPWVSYEPGLGEAAVEEATLSVVWGVVGTGSLEWALLVL